MFHEEEDLNAWDWIFIREKERGGERSNCFLIKNILGLDKIPEALREIKILKVGVEDELSGLGLHGEDDWAVFDEGGTKHDGLN